MGATPVPGPTQIIGVVRSSGRVTNPLEIPTRMVTPFDEINTNATYGWDRELPGTRVDK